MFTETEPPVAVDYECYYDKIVSVKTVGAYKYLRDPKCDIFLASLFDGAGPGWAGDPDNFDWESISGRDWVSHNRSFDKLVFERLQELGRIPSWVTYRNWFCSADLASYLKSKRALKDALRILLNITVSKDIRTKMKGLTAEQMMGLVLTKTGKLVPKESILNFEGVTFYDLVVEYALSDAKNCWLLWTQFCHLFPERERRLSWLTTLQAHRGIHIDRDKLNTDVGMLHDVKAVACKSIPWAKQNEDGSWDDEGVLSLPKLHKQIDDAGLRKLSTTSEDSQELRQWELDHPRVPWTKAMRDFRKANIMLRRCEHVLNRLTGDNRFMFAWLYAGAHTLRWAGGSSHRRGGTGESGFNIQNVQKKPVYITGNYHMTEDKDE